jgi:uncharacterized protein
MRKSEIQAYINFVKPHYEDKDPGHDFDHIKRIISRIPELENEVASEPDKSKLWFLACFHGLDKKLSGDRDFKEQTTNFLLSLSWDKKEIDILYKSLSEHMVNPATIEEKIICDANNLDLLGAIGIAKAFTTGGVKRQLFLETIEIFEKRYLDQAVFQTPVGKRIFKKQLNYVKEFLLKLKKELDDYVV